MQRRQFLTSAFSLSALTLSPRSFAKLQILPRRRSYGFNRTISREVLENYLSRSITMQGLLNGCGDLNDNIRMLQHIGAKYIGRSICLWGSRPSPAGDSPGRLRG